MPASPIDVLLIATVIALLVLNLIRRRTLRRRKVTDRLAFYSVTRWVWTALLVLSIVSIVLEHGRVAVPWLVALLAAIETLLTWTVHVLRRQAEKSAASKT